MNLDVVIIFLVILNHMEMGEKISMLLRQIYMASKSGAKPMGAEVMIVDNP